MKILIRYLVVVLSIGKVFGQKSEKIELIEFSQSDCDAKVDARRIKPRIISLDQHADTLTLEIGFAAACGTEYVPDITYAADTLYIEYNAKGDQGYCACCYSFNHKIKGLNSPTFTVRFFDTVIELSDEKYWTYPPTYTIVKGDTLNRTDKYGLKQGIWIEERVASEWKADTLQQKGYDLEQVLSTSKIISFFRYEDDKYFKWGHLYQHNLKIKDEYDSNTGIRREYYKNGRIRSECVEKAGVATGCRQWESNGREIK